ncbi:MAG: CDP-alcohol phosphatidyltransferase family protein [Gemmataceae bacterium]
MNRVPVLPTLLTLGNGMCGFAAIAYASKIVPGKMPEPTSNESYYLFSAALIFLAMMFDVLDGYAARLSKTASEFGGQLDSLCDAISFGLAPAFLLLRLGLEWNQQPIIGKAVAIIAGLYLACTVLRLARFNLENDPDPASHRRFKGLPSPAAAGCLASLAILRGFEGSDLFGLNDEMIHGFIRVAAPLGAMIAALLMVSHLPYPHLGRQLLSGKKHFRFVVQLLLFGAIMAILPQLTFFLLFWSYALFPPLKFLARQLTAERSPENNPQVHG